MYKGSMTLFKGIGIGIIGGMILGSYSKNMIGNNKVVKRRAGKAVHAVGDFIESVPYMFR